MRDNIRLVLLNACLSGSQARVAARTIEATVGIVTDIGDEAAIAFVAVFYRAIGFDRSIQRALERGQSA